MHLISKNMYIDMSAFVRQLALLIVILHDYIIDYSYLASYCLYYATYQV